MTSLPTQRYIPSGKNSSRLVYDVELAAGTTKTRIETFSSPLPGRLYAEMLCKTMGLPMHDESSGALIVRSKDSLDESLTTVLRREASTSDPGPAPGSRLAPEPVDGGLRLSFPQPNGAQGIFVVLLAGFFGLFGAFIAGPGAGALLGLVGAIFAAFAWLSVVIEDHLVADQDNLTLTLRRFSGGSQTVVIRWSELEELHSSQGMIHAAGDRAVLSFGRSLSNDERAWLVKLLRHHAASLPAVPSTPSPVEPSVEPLVEPVIFGRDNSREARARLLRLVFPVSLFSVPLALMQFNDLKQRSQQYIPLEESVLELSGYGALQTSLLALAGFVVALWARTGLPPLALAGRIAFASALLYPPLLWLLATKVSVLSGMQSAVMVSVAMIFGLTGLALIGGRSLEAPLQALHVGAGLVWALNAINALAYDRQYELPYGHSGEFIAWASPSFMLFWGFPGWQIWCVLAGICGFWLAVSADARPAKLLALLLAILILLLGVDLAPGLLVPPAPTHLLSATPWLILANSLAAIGPLAFFYYWLAKELEALKPSSARRGPQGLD